MNHPKCPVILALSNTEYHFFRELPICFTTTLVWPQLHLPLSSHRLRGTAGPALQSHWDDPRWGRCWPSCTPRWRHPLSRRQSHTWSGCTDPELRDMIFPKRHGRNMRKTNSTVKTTILWSCELNHRQHLLKKGILRGWKKQQDDAKPNLAVHTHLKGILAWSDMETETCLFRMISKAGRKYNSWWMMVVIHSYPRLKDESKERYSKSNS